MKNKENTSLIRRFGRLLYLKLIVPLKRSKHPVSYTARGVLVGMMWAMTPLVGIQMTTVWFTWITAKFLFKWDFSLPVALAWTWVTNVFTMFPIYSFSRRSIRWEVLRWRAMPLRRVLKEWPMLPAELITRRR